MNVWLLTILIAAVVTAGTIAALVFASKKSN